MELPQPAKNPMTGGRQDHMTSDDMRVLHPRLSRLHAQRMLQETHAVMRQVEAGARTWSKASRHRPAVR